MEKRGRRKHQSHKRGQVIVNEHRTYLEGTPGGAITVAKLDRAVADQSTAYIDQENAHLEQQSAANRAEKSRRALQNGVKHMATVSAVVTPAGGASAPFDPVRPTNDEQLIARVEAIHAAASADADLFVKGGVQPGFLDALSSELAAFRTAKDTLTLAGRQHAEARERFDRALDDGDEAFAVLEGILATSPDAPVGALTALRHAKRIGPRVEVDVKPPQPGPTPDAPVAPPATPAAPDTVV